MERKRTQHITVAKVRYISRNRSVFSTTASYAAITCAINTVVGKQGRDVLASRDFFLINSKSTLHVQTGIEETRTDIRMYI